MKPGLKVRLYKVDNQYFYLWPKLNYTQTEKQKKTNGKKYFNWLVDVPRVECAFRGKDGKIYDLVDR